MRIFFTLLLLGLLVGSKVQAQPVLPALSGQLFVSSDGPAAPLIPALMRPGPPDAGAAAGQHAAQETSAKSASLFGSFQEARLLSAALRSDSIEGPRPYRSTATPRLFGGNPSGGAHERAAHHLRHLIASAEAGAMGYDAVQYGARSRPPAQPTAMTLAQISNWITRTPGQPHAIGRYQFIPSTLWRLVKDQNIPMQARFSPQLQDRLADQLLREAGLEAAVRGELSRTGFMNNLAKIWAGLPNSSGRSHYHGYAGNKATMSWTEYTRAMSVIFPG
ncbi:hypothetical protein ERN12_04595 [Rhodobacteraceae bacterium]|nr:hypothetical protein ERN12_04595 [Paracoccaceae bacterium]